MEKVQIKMLTEYRWMWVQSFTYLENSSGYFTIDFLKMIQKHSATMKMPFRSRYDSLATK